MSGFTSMPNGYDNPAPWVFKGKALYQLQLVPTEEAKKHIPSEFKIVDFMGYTLGGLYLARYSDSPVGVFDELVVMGGLVWNPPTSCAWASRVYVTNRDARNHGLGHVGLPSRLASFTDAPNSTPAADSVVSWWGQKNRGAALVTASGRKDSPAAGAVVLRNIESGSRGMRDAVCRMELPKGRGESEMAGPEIKISLPSFSGGTVDHPGFLKYACDLVTRVRISPPIRLSFPQTEEKGRGAPSAESMVTVMSGRPLLTLAFDDFVMKVGSPVAITVGEGQSQRQKADSKGPHMATVTSGGWAWPQWGGQKQ